MSLSSRFIKYMVSNHPEELKEFINNYPTNKTFTIEYQSLKKYDEDLAELIKEKPEIMLEAISTKICESTSKIKDGAEIQFNIINFDNIVELKDISSEHIGELIRFNAYVHKGTGKNLIKFIKQFSTR